METVTVVIESPVKYDMPYSDGLRGHIGDRQQNRKSKIEKIIDKIAKSIRERD
ncbi:MAG: hypothetical protein J6S23_01085 [Clostridia bacterium]|nr:hypothetical protein [Clostridia bacterium]